MSKKSIVKFQRGEEGGSARELASRELEGDRATFSWDEETTRNASTSSSKEGRHMKRRIKVGMRLGLRVGRSCKWLLKGVEVDE